MSRWPKVGLSSALLLQYLPRTCGITLKYNVQESFVFRGSFPTHDDELLSKVLLLTLARDTGMGTRCSAPLLRRSAARCSARVDGPPLQREEKSQQVELFLEKFF
jgi:hypothetical protein